MTQGVAYQISVTLANPSMQRKPLIGPLI